MHGSLYLFLFFHFGNIYCRNGETKNLGPFSSGKNASLIEGADQEHISLDYSHFICSCNLLFQTLELYLGRER